MRSFISICSLARVAPLATVLVIAACGSSSPPGDDDDAPAGPVYYGQVDRILADNCVACHSADPARLAPFSLATYDDAVAAAADQPVAYAVMNRIMPPYYADDSGSCQSFRDNMWLSDADMATVVDWVNGAHAAGDVANATPPPPSLPTLADPSAVVDIGADYLPDSTLTDDYRCFVVDPGVATDQFLTAYQVHPGNANVVHHAILFSLPTAAAEADAVQRDAAAGGMGYPCIGGTGVTGATMLGGWAPGSGANFLPDGTGLAVPGGRKMILQVHYNLATSDGLPDRTTVDLALAPSVTTEARILPVTANIDLPPGQPDVAAVGTLHIPAFIPAFRVWGEAMHMHNRGLGGSGLRDATTDTCLIQLTNWSFHWQHQYWYEQPLTLHGGDDLEVTCHFDTGDDTAPVHWGEGTEDEMCIAFLYVST